MNNEILICNFERQNEINKRILERNIPFCDRNNPININEVNDNKRIYFRFFEIESSKVIRTKKPITRAIYEPREYVKNKFKKEIIKSTLLNLFSNRYCILDFELIILERHTKEYKTQIIPITFGPPP